LPTKQGEPQGSKLLVSSLPRNETPIWNVKLLPLAKGLSAVSEVDHPLTLLYCRAFGNSFMRAQHSALSLLKTLMLLSRSCSRPLTLLIYLRPVQILQRRSTAPRRFAQHLVETDPAAPRKHDEPPSDWKGDLECGTVSYDVEPYCKIRLQKQKRSTQNGKAEVASLCFHLKDPTLL